MIRVLQIFTIMNHGGAETMIMNYYRNIDRTKVQFDFMVHRQERGAYDDEIEILGGKIYRMPSFNPLNIINYNDSLYKFFQEHKEYKIVHAHNCTMNMWNLRAAQKSGIPVTIAHSHLAKRELDYKTPFFLYNNMKINKFSLHKFACSNAAAKWHFGNKISDVRIIPNAIDSRKYRYNVDTRKAIRKQLGILENEFVIGHVGRFNKSKNHNFIIDIFENIINKGKTAKLVLVGGKDTEEENIKNRVYKEHLDGKIVILGIRDDIPDIMQAFDVFLFPSLFEALPVTLIEAQASGLKCIVSDGVPKESNIADLVEYYSLENSAEYWAAQVLKYSTGYKRKNMYDDIVKVKFDIKENAEWLQEFYLNEYEKYKE